MLNGEINIMPENFCVKIGSLSVNGPFTIPSGIVTTVPSVISRLAREIPSLGFLTTKTISLEPRPGYREPILHEYHPGCFANAVGLANPGAHSFLESMRPLKPLSGNKPLIISIMGSSPEEFLQCCKILEPVADAFELNLSCPHVKGAGQSVGSDPDLVKKILNILSHNIKKPLIPKLSPNLSNFDEMVSLCEKEGADALCLINTVGPGTVVDQDGSPILSNINGGLSGAAIKPLGLKLVRQAATLVKIPIIGCGGISSPEDVRAYSLAGAALFGIGSSLALMETEKLADFFNSLVSGLDAEPTIGRQNYSSNHTRRTDYVSAPVLANTKIAENIFEISLDRSFKCDPGQFFFLRIPEVGEKPFSPLSSNPLSFLVRAIGPFTRSLEKLAKNDRLQFRGPYGKGFPSAIPQVPLIMVGGGTGVGPIIMAAEKLSAHGPEVFLGFSADVDLSLLQSVDANSMKPKVAIDHPGQPGEVVRLLSNEILTRKKDFINALVFVCGPSRMMQEIKKSMGQVTSCENIFVAREDVMKCGIGICGSCGTPSGMRSCVDGPVMSLE